MAKLQIKKGDTVVVISGKDKGKQGTVIATEPKKERVFVEGVNTVKRHTKPSQANPQGGIVKKGLELGTPYELTWSCYEGGDRPCGTCGTCIDRARAFAANGVPDPALEEK